MAGGGRRVLKFHVLNNNSLILQCRQIDVVYKEETN